MTRPKSSDLVNRTRFSGALDTQLYDSLEELHQKTRVPKNRLYDEAIVLLLEKHNIEIPKKN